MGDYRTMTNLVPGIRNNNPGNIKSDNGIYWEGMVGDDGIFDIFSDTTWGLRALATDLANKINRGLNTIRLIVSDYAPPSENNTPAYIAAVANDTGIGPDDLLSKDQITLHDLMRAIINHENGVAASYQYYPDADIDTGIGMMSGNLLTTFQAAGVAVQNDVGGSGTILAIGGAALLLWLIFR